MMKNQLWNIRPLNYESFNKGTLDLDTLLPFMCVLLIILATLLIFTTNNVTQKEIDDMKETLRIHQDHINPNDYDVVKLQSAHIPQSNGTKEKLFWDELDVNGITLIKYFRPRDGEGRIELRKGHICYGKIETGQNLTQEVRISSEYPVLSADNKSALIKDVNKTVVVIFPPGSTRSAADYRIYNLSCSERYNKRIEENV